MKKEEKSKKNKIPVWAIILIIIFGLMMVSPILFFVGVIAIDGISGDNVQKDLIITSVTSSGCNKEEDEYIIIGTIKNTSDDDYTGVYISYNLYDEDDNIIGIASDNIERLDKGETWKYSAAFPTKYCKDVDKHKFYEIDGYKNDFLFE